MSEHYKISDEDFVLLFETQQLNPSLFTHEAHLRLAWIYIRKYGISAATHKIAMAIKSYAESQGAFDKFNKTLTMAATKAVHHFMLKSKSNSFKDFLKEFPRLGHSFKALMEAHYSFDIYHSDRAKKEYLAPDLLPFD